MIRFKTEAKKRIAVLFGGCSPEYSVSLESAYAVIIHIDRGKYLPVLIGISDDGKWFKYDGDIKKIPENRWCNEDDCTPVAVSPDRTAHELLIMKDGRVEKMQIDAAFPILHGKNGEDGTVQGVFELAGIPVIGCGVLSSALCMDKELSHRIVGTNGIKVAKSITIKSGYSEEGVKKEAMDIGFPLFVKPVRAGSSFGITKVTDEENLISAIENAFLYDNTVILEEMIDGFEVGCAVLGTNNLLIGEIDEIELSDGFFDYTEKYTLKTSDIHVPARISAGKAEEIKKTALAIYKILQCSFFARVDMFLTPAGEIYFNEVNTIPGFTSHSRYPIMLGAIGLSFEDIINHLLEMEAVSGLQGEGEKEDVSKGTRLD